MRNDQSKVLTGLGRFVEERETEFDAIPRDRKAKLEKLSSHVRERLDADLPVRLVFICTHNSRRSHMAQLWAEVAARHFSINGLEFFSGGTETRAFNPRAVAALRRAGFVIDFFSDGKNPVYEVSFTPEMEPLQAFSKVYDEQPNPTEGFAAIMTCSAADNDCPVVAGADERIVISYDDPKDFDGTEREAEIYDERCREIAREMLYIFAVVADKA